MQNQNAMPVLSDRGSKTQPRRDNVGDCAAHGADLFESIVVEIISDMVLGGTMAPRCKIKGGFVENGLRRQPMTLANNREMLKDNGMDSNMLEDKIQRRVG
nr:pyrophosphate-energized membrane proton pump 3 [Tanacetum cinerariifolium]